MALQRRHEEHTHAQKIWWTSLFQIQGLIWQSHRRALIPDTLVTNPSQVQGNGGNKWDMEGTQGAAQQPRLQIDKEFHSC